MIMKNLIILALFVGLLTSCMHPTYRTKDKFGNVIHVIDMDGEVESAIALEVDSITVVTSGLQEYYKPAGHIRKDTIMFYSSYVDGIEYSGYLEYKVVKVRDLHRR